METIEKDFIANIQAHPNDDEARKVYADWLQENGRLDDAMYVLFSPPKASIKFRLAFNGVKEIRCNKCNLPADHADLATVAFGAAYCCNIKNCSEKYKWFNFSLEAGTTYKFNKNSFFQWWNGIDGKFWIEIKTEE